MDKGVGIYAISLETEGELFVTEVLWSEKQWPKLCLLARKGFFIWYSIIHTC